MIFTHRGPGTSLPSRRVATAVFLVALCGASSLAQTGTQTPGTVVASPGSTVVVQPSQPADKDDKKATTTHTPGLIVAAPGSTVVVANPPPAPVAKKAATPPNTFSAQESSVVQDLLKTAKNTKLTTLARTGAIDALGSIGGDATIAYDIAKGLGEVLDQEFITNMTFSTNGEFICYHTVKALGQLGWGGKATLSKLQQLRGQSVILDTAIDYSVNAIKTGAKPAPAGGGDGGS
ncbi:MAG TPA: hypothetical protein VG097_17625 [Gemmata sp.]|jgi:hypothetical protein|nr:hypothetical protein [Gemmata sp.]